MTKRPLSQDVRKTAQFFCSLVIFFILVTPTIGHAAQLTADQQQIEDEFSTFLMSTPYYSECMQKAGQNFGNSEACQKAASDKIQASPQYQTCVQSIRAPSSTSDSHFISVSYSPSASQNDVARQLVDCEEKAYQASGGAAQGPGGSGGTCTAPGIACAKPNPPGGTTTPPGGTTTPPDGPIVQQDPTYPDLPNLPEIVKTCQTDQTTATQCCNDPAKCLDSDASVGGMGSINTLMQMAAAGTAMGGSGKSISEICGLQSKISLLSAGVNGSMAAVCTTKRSQCQSSCGSDLLARLNKEWADCDKDAKCRVEYPQAHTQIAQLEVASNKCDSLTAQIGKMGVLAAQGVQAAQLDSLCQQQTKPDPNLIPNSVQANYNCLDPSSASSPACQAMCGQPGSENYAACQPKFNAPGTGAAGAGTVASVGEFGARGSNKPGFDESNPGLNPDALKQGTNFGQPGDQKASSSGVPNNPGGGLISGSGGGFGGGSGGQGQGGPGYNTNTLHGTGGVSGYTVSSMGTTSYGGGYGYGSVGSTKVKGTPFTLKDYLPGGKAYKLVHNQNRAPASLHMLPKNADMFEEVHKTYQRLCNEGKFDTCPGK